MADGVPVPLYLDTEAEKQKAIDKKNGKENTNRSNRSNGNDWPSILNIENILGRNKVSTHVNYQMRTCNFLFFQYFLMIIFNIPKFSF